MKKLQFTVKISGQVIDECETTNLFKETRRVIDGDMKINVSDNEVNINIDDLRIQEHYSSTDKKTMKKVFNNRTKKVKDLKVCAYANYSDVVAMALTNLLSK